MIKKYRFVPMKKLVLYVFLATLFIYVAGSPIIFMKIHHVDLKTFNGIFALLSVGFIGSSQLNILVNRNHKSDKIFRIALFVQVAAGLVFLIGVLTNSFGCTVRLRCSLFV